MLFKIQAATLAARQRLNDQAIATRVDNGKVQVVRVTYPNGKDAEESPVSDWMPASEVCEFLNKL